MPNDLKTDLLPCPFCGGLAIIDHIPLHSHPGLTVFMADDPGSWVIECEGDCCFGLIREKREAVIAAWNRRAP